MVIGCGDLLMGIDFLVRIVFLICRLLVFSSLRFVVILFLGFIRMRLLGMRFLVGMLCWLLFCKIVVCGVSMLWIDFIVFLVCFF